VALVGLVVVIAGLYFGRQVLIPLALAVVFAFLLTPLVGLLEKCHIGRVPSVLAALVLSFALLAVVSWGVATQLVEIMVHLPDYRANIHKQDRSQSQAGDRRLGSSNSDGQCYQQRVVRRFGNSRE
jgi:predicted PurR-regulated permease PerM